MIDRRRDEAYIQYLESHRRGRTILQKLADAREKAGQIVDRLTHDRKPTMVYGLPVSGRLKPYLQSKEVFDHMPNPLKLPLFEMTQDLIRKKDSQGAIFDAAVDTTQKNGVLFQTDHSRDLARAAVSEREENATRVTGLEVFVSEVMKQAGDNGSSFHSIEFNGRSMPLVKKDGSSVLLHSIFDKMPKPMTPGSVMRFVSSERALKVTVLTTPKDIQTPYVCLLGAKKDENGSLSKAMVKARARGERIAVIYKEGDDGIVNGFVQGQPGDTDVFDVSPRKNRVLRKNGEYAEQYSLPPIPEGQTQVVVLPVEGSIEDYVAGRLKLPCDIPKLKAVYGIDVVQSGRSMMKADVVPVQFRLSRKYVSPARIKEWYEKDPKKFQQYIRRTAIMPVHLIAVQTEKLDSDQAQEQQVSRFKKLLRRKK